MRQEFIEVRAARENNLRDVSVSIPKRRITVFTGVSGSGKSSLVFDTLAAEAQRLLNETFTTFVRNRLPRYGQPDADAIENLSTAIVIDQKRLGGNSRSTLGTVTDVNSMLRLLFSRVGKPFVGYSNALSFNDPEGMCPECSGIGKKLELDLDEFLDASRSLTRGRCSIPPSPWARTDGNCTSNPVCSTTARSSPITRRRSGRRFCTARTEGRSGSALPPDPWWATTSRASLTFSTGSTSTPRRARRPRRSATNCDVSCRSRPVRPVRGRG